MRSRGKGSLGKWRDGWRASVSKDGKRAYVYGKTKVETEKKLKELITTLATPVAQAPKAEPEASQGLSLSDATERYLRDRIDIEEGTRNGYRTHLQFACVHFGADRRIDSLSAQDIAEYGAKLRDQNLSTSTIRKRIITLRALLRTYTDFSGKVSIPRLSTVPSLTLTTAQARVLLDALPGHWLEGHLRLALTAGMRSGEISGLTWQDLDLAHARLTVREVFTAGQERTLPKKQAKTRAGQRVVPLVPETVAFLASLEQGKPSDLVFRRPDGGPYRGDSFARVLRRLCLKHNLPIVKFHGLRHTNATILLEAGVSPLQVAALLGHSNVQVTLSIYAHLTKRMEEQAVGVLSSVFSPVPHSYPTAESQGRLTEETTQQM